MDDYFWEKFLSTVEQHGVPANQAKQYVGWAKRFAAAMGTIPLQQRKPGDIMIFLRTLAADQEVAFWQVAQASEAMRLLYRYHLKVPMVDDAFWVALVGPDEPRIRSAVLEAACRQAHDGPDAEIPTTHHEVLHSLQQAFRGMGYANSTSKIYQAWVKRFLAFCKVHRIKTIDGAAARRYLDSRACGCQPLCPATRLQAQDALLFLFGQVLHHDPGDLNSCFRGMKKTALPLVLSQQEVGQLLAAMNGVPQFMARTLYDAGLRLMECVRLRVNNIDLDREQLAVVDGAGRIDRRITLSPLLADLFRARLLALGPLYEADLLQGAAWSWEQQYLFPARRLSVARRSDELRCHHLHPTTLQRAVKQAVRRVGLAPAVSCQTLRHSAALHRLAAGAELSALQAFLGHHNPGSTAVYIRLLHQLDPVK